MSSVLSKMGLDIPAVVPDQALSETIIAIVVRCENELMLLKRVARSPKMNVDPETGSPPFPPSLVAGLVPAPTAQAARREDLRASPGSLVTQMRVFATARTKKIKK